MDSETLTGANSTEKRFKRDMERAGFEVRTYPCAAYGRDTYAVEACMGGDPYGHLGYEHPDVQDVVRATKLRVRWDGCGGLIVVMPEW